LLREFAELFRYADPVKPEPRPWDTSDMAHRSGGLSVEQEPVGFNGLTKLETSQTMSVSGLSEPKQPESLRLADKLADRILDIHCKLAAKELRRLHEFELSHGEWITKTEWMKAAPHELGMHKADVLKQRIDRLHEVNQELVEALKWAVDCLHFDSSMPEAMANLDNAYAALAKARGTE